MNIKDAPSPDGLRPLRAMLVFNPAAGATRDTPQLVDLVRELQAWRVVPEVFLLEAEVDLAAAVSDALARGIRSFVACGGDGTISAVARLLVGTRATLGIIPSGTRNNVALSLGLPTDLPSAVALLRAGTRKRLDVGGLTRGDATLHFLEVCSVGLASALFPAADDIQHGDLTRIGDLLATLAGSPPSDVRILLDGRKEVRGLCHVVVVSNVPYVGPNYWVGSAASPDDGLLDVLFFADLSKLDLLGAIAEGAGIDWTADPRVQHYHARTIEIESQPAMPVVADGVELGEGRLRIEVRRRALAVMVQR